MSLDLEEILIRKGTTRNRMTSRPKGLLSNYDDIWLLDGVHQSYAMPAIFVRRSRTRLAVGFPRSEEAP